MTRPESDRPESSASSSDDRFWQAFAQAGGFDDEFRELLASGEIAPADVATAEVTPEDLLAADRLHELLLAARPIPVERAPQPVSFRAWIAAGTLAAIGTAAAVAAVAWLEQAPSSNGEVDQEVAAVELAEAWIAVRESSVEPDALYVGAADSEIADLDPAESDGSAEALAFDETPEWLALAVAGEAELSEEAVEEATP